MTFVATNARLAGSTIMNPDDRPLAYAYQEAFDAWSRADIDYANARCSPACEADSKPMHHADCPEGLALKAEKLAEAALNVAHQAWLKSDEERQWFILVHGTKEMLDATPTGIERELTAWIRDGQWNARTVVYGNAVAVDPVTLDDIRDTAICVRVSVDPA